MRRSARVDRTIDPRSASLLFFQLPMVPVLKDILARKASEVARAKELVPLEALKEQIGELGRPRNFFQSVVDRRHPNSTHAIA